MAPPWSAARYKASSNALFLESSNLVIKNAEIYDGIENNSYQGHILINDGVISRISKTTAPHAVSYPFTALYNISHGHAVSLTLNKYLEDFERFKSALQIMANSTRI